MADVLLPGIAATTVATSRSDPVRAASRGRRPGRAGGGRALRARQRQLVAVLAAAAAGARGHGPAPRARRRPARVRRRPSRCPIDATRGVRDWADDIAALVEALGLTRVHLVGWSMGAGVVLQYLLDAPERVASVALVAPVSPYGFGGTAGTGRAAACTPTAPGCGGGAANPDFVAAIAAGDTTDGQPVQPAVGAAVVLRGPGLAAAGPDARGRVRRRR